MSNVEYLIEKYGILMSLADLAATLKRSTEGVRYGLHTDSEFYRAINAARVRLGRRVYFHTVKIAAVLDCH